MSHPSKVAMIGPLASCQAQLTTEFLRRGYAPSTVSRQLQLLAHLSQWMSAHSVAITRLSWAHIDLFCSERGMTCLRRGAPPPIRMLMGLMRPDETPAKAAHPGSVLPDETEELLACFDRYLHDERALSPKTSALYLYQVRVFAGWFIARTHQDLAVMTSAAINEFYLDRSDGWSGSSARSSTIALRALSRWLFLTGRSSSDLSTAIMTVKDTTGNDLPKALPAADVTRLLSVDMSGRDKTILLLLTRLGLRAHEVSGLTLKDFDWGAGTVLIWGKGGNAQLMPVPADVGEAVAIYLSTTRKAGLPHRTVFLGTYAPIDPVGSSAISMVVTNLAKRAGIAGRVGAHRLRHSAATAVLAGGGTMEEAAQLLRHRSSQSTMTYARTDLGMLAHISRPWPALPLPGDGHE